MPSQLTDRFTIRLARPEEANYLTGLAMRSKAHWGYSEDLLRSWEDDMRVDLKSCEAGKVWIIDNDGVVPGFAELIIDGTIASIDDLWIDPPHMRHGYGTALFHHLVEKARTRRMA